MTEQSASAIRYDADGKCLDCGGVGGCHALTCPPAAAQYADAAASTDVLDKMGRHFASNPYLTFQDMTRDDGRLTRLIEVIAVRDGTLLGVIRWFGSWRQYVFAPEPECVFNVGCLKTIERNVQVMNEIQKRRL